MKKYVVGILSFFENDIRLFKIDAEDAFEACKKAMIEFTSEEYRQGEIDFQNSEDYPDNLDDLESYLSDCDMTISILEL